MSYAPCEDALIGQIGAAYKALKSTRRELSRAETARERHERRLRVQNESHLKGAQNERTAKLYLEELLDTEEYKKLENTEKKAEVDHFDAKAEVDRLQLVVRLLRARSGALTGEEARA